MTKILRVVNLTKSFEGLRAVDRASLAIERGSLTGLIGPNGSGKTTLFNLISGTLKPDAGEIYFEEERIDRLSPEVIFEKGLVRSFQTPRLWFRMNVLDNSMVSPRHQIGENLRNAPLHQTWRSQEIQLAEKFCQVMKLLQLKPVVKNLASEISGGQMKLLEMCRCLMGEPKMILLDEPGAGVAPKLAREIFGHIKRLRDELGLTFLIVEHDLELLFDFADYVYVMDQGQKIFEGTPNEVVKSKKLVEIYLGA